MIIDALNCSNWDKSLFEEAQAGGVTCAHVTLAVWETARETLSQVDKWYRFFRMYPDLIMPVQTAADIRKAEASGKVGILLGFQGPSPIEDDLGMVEVFHRLGIRVMQITYNNASLLGGGCYEQTDGGLTRFGREVVKEMNRLGMVVDLSHVGEQTTLDAIRFSEQPVAVTHSNPHWLSHIPRNKSQTVLTELAAAGGMLGCSLYPFLIGGPDVTLQQFCESIARAAELMGAEKLGIGTDLVRKCTPEYLDWLRSGRWTHTVSHGPAGPAAKAGWPEWQTWFKTPLDFGVVEAGLRDVGFSAEETAGIMGENWLRYFEQIIG
ncbi:MAG: membrane dipeptidase [Cellvibrionaceae bacterium]|jgi:membrane dipeptidase